MDIKHLYKPARLIVIAGTLICSAASLLTAVAPFGVA